MSGFRRGRTFPEYFYSLFYDAMVKLVEALPENDEKVVNTSAISTIDLADRRIAMLHRVHKSLVHHISSQDNASQGERTERTSMYVYILID
jgi:hypothetical protein